MKKLEKDLARRGASNALYRERGICKTSLLYIPLLCTLALLLTGCSATGIRLACATIFRPVCLPIAVANAGIDFTTNLASRIVPGEGHLEVPVHGNWCGPGRPKQADSDPEPVDALDATCKRHDLCYLKRGYQNCKCDEELVKDIVGTRGLGELSFTEHAIVTYFRRSYCSGCKQTTVGSSTLRIGRCSGGEFYRRSIPW